jgi:O-antigen/teichoic acid export membrane protein
MLATRKIAHNTIIQIIGKAANVLIGVLAISYLTRYLSPAGFGQYTTVLTFLQIFGIFLDFGLYLILLQEIGKDEENKNFIFSNILTMRIISGFSFFIIAPALAFFFPYPMIVKIGIALTSLAFFLNSLVQIYTTVFQKEMKMHKVVLAEIIAKILFLIFIIITISKQGNLLIVLTANVVNSLVFFTILAFLARKYIKYKWQLDWKYVQKIIKLSWPIGLAIMLNLIYFKADTLILSIFKPAAHVGYYGAPYKILEVITTLPHLILGLILPILAAYWFQNKKEEFKKVFQNMFDFFVVLGVLIIILFTTQAEGIINFIAGSEYSTSVQILKILIWPTTIIFFGNLFNYGIIAVEKQKQTIKYFLITALISIVGYFIFIPKFSYLGAAYMTLFAEVLITVFSYFLLKSYTGWKINSKVLLKTLGIGIGCYLFLDFITMNFVVELIIGIGVYLVLLVLFKVLGKDLIKEVLKVRNNT